MQPTIFALSYNYIYILYEYVYIVHMLYICCCYCNPGFELPVGLVASDSSRVEPVHYFCTAAGGGGRADKKSLVVPCSRDGRTSVYRKDVVYSI